MTIIDQPQHMTTVYGGFDPFDTLVHPDHEGTFHPWKTPWEMLKDGQLILRSVDGNDIVTVDLERVELWEIKHPSWCTPTSSCHSTRNVGSVTHRGRILKESLNAGEASDRDEGEAQDFTVDIMIEEVADGIGRAGAALHVTFDGDIADGSITGSPAQIRELARVLMHAGKAAAEHQDLDYQPRR